MAYERTLKDVQNFVFDLDGTIWEWNRLKDGVQETIEDLEERGKNIYYLTNNSVLKRDGYAEKLNDLGLAVSQEQVISVSYIASQVFDEQDIRKVYTVTEEGFRDELERNSITHSEEAEHVVIGVDRNFSYWKAATAADLVRDGAKLWAACLDDAWNAGDRTLPGAGALLQTVRRAADTDEVAVLGKPSEYTRDIVKEEWNLLAGNTIVIGDNLKSDVVLGNRMGYMTGLVLGGASSEEDLNDAGPHEKPNIVFREFERIMMKV